MSESETSTDTGGVYITRQEFDSYTNAVGIKLDRFETQLRELENIVAPEPVDGATYADLSRDQKINHIRKNLLRSAQGKTSGTYSAKYGEVKGWFRSELSDGAYHGLMKEVGEKDGYAYDKNDSGTYRVRVDLNELQSIQD